MTARGKLDYSYVCACRKPALPGDHTRLRCSLDLPACGHVTCVGGKRCTTSKGKPQGKPAAAATSSTPSKPPSKPTSKPRGKRKGKGAAA